MTVNELRFLGAGLMFLLSLPLFAINMSAIEDGKAPSRWVDLVILQVPVSVIIPAAMPGAGILLAAVLDLACYFATHPRKHRTEDKRS